MSLHQICVPEPGLPWDSAAKASVKTPSLLVNRVFLSILSSREGSELGLCVWFRALSESPQVVCGIPGWSEWGEGH